MRLLLVDDGDSLLWFLAKELENRGCDVHQSSSGDEAFHVWQRLVPLELVLTDYRFFPGLEIKNGVELVTAIHSINAAQRMGIMTAWCDEVREKLPQALRFLPLLEKPFRFEQVLRLLREPVLPL